MQALYLQQEDLTLAVDPSKAVPLLIGLRGRSSTAQNLLCKHLIEVRGVSERF